MGTKRAELDIFRRKLRRVRQLLLLFRFTSFLGGKFLTTGITINVTLLMVFFVEGVVQLLKKILKPLHLLNARVLQLGRF